MNVKFPVEKYIDGEFTTIYELRPAELITGSYYRVKTDETGINWSGKRQTYRQCEVYLEPNYAWFEANPTLTIEAAKEEFQNLKGADLWRYARAGIVPLRDNDQEQYFYDVWESTTGYVLTRCFRGQCRPFVEMFIKNRFYWKGEIEEEIEVGRGNTTTMARKVLGVFGNDSTEIRSYRKLEKE